LIIVDDLSTNKETINYIMGLKHKNIMKVFPSKKLYCTGAWNMELKS